MNIWYYCYDIEDKFHFTWKNWRKIIKNQEKLLRKIIKAQENLKTQGKNSKLKEKLKFSAYSYVGPEEKMAKK